MTVDKLLHDTGQEWQAVTNLIQISNEQLEQKIYQIRGQKVMLDSDLAVLYGVETKRLNEQVKRNAERFPVSFMFQLTYAEEENLKSQFATSSLERHINKEKHGGRRKPVSVFTEHGVLMLANVLRSNRAIAVSIQGDKVWLIDYNNPENNEFLAVNQLEILENNVIKIPDIIIYITACPW